MSCLLLKQGGGGRVSKLKQGIHEVHGGDEALLNLGMVVHSLTIYWYKVKKLYSIEALSSFVSSKYDEVSEHMELITNTSKRDM